MGSFGILLDPTGAALGVWEPAMQAAPKAAARKPAAKKAAGKKKAPAKKKASRKR
jgi:hypothetical protein